MERRILGIGFLAAVAFLLLPGISHAQSGQTTTLSSQYIHWDQLPGVSDADDCSSSGHIGNNGSGGTNCYSKQVTVPSGANTLLVNVSANGEVFNDFDDLSESVNLGPSLGVDGPAACVNGSGDIEDLIFTGWIPLLKISADGNPTFLDLHRLIGNMSYTWCCVVPKPPLGTTAKPFVNVKFGSGHDNDFNVEQVTVTIQAAGIPTANACTGSTFND